MNAIRKDATLKKKPSSPPAEAVPWQQRTWPWAFLSAVLLWASFPPLDLWPLAWLAPIPWLVLIRQPRLRGWKPYLVITLAGFTHWLLVLQGIRLAHDALYGGWIALSAYLAMYLVLFISISRVAVHRLRCPLFLAAPIVWVGLEFLRSNLISGFACGLLAHTQTSWPMVLQIADIGGAYALSFLMMLVAAVVAQYLSDNWFPAPANPESKPTLFARGPIPAAVAFSLLALTLAYGWFRLHEEPPRANVPPLRVALIQGSLDTRFDQPFEERINETLSHYTPLTRTAIEKQPNTDLVVWPESMFVIPEFRTHPVEQATDPAIPADRRERIAVFQQGFAAAQRNLQHQMPASHFLFGTTTFEFDLTDDRGQPSKNYNTALLTAPDGQFVGRYYKMHPVMFGEFIPLADLFPFLYSVTPMGTGMSIGDKPVLLKVKDTTLAPNICFESTVPHLIREQVSRLEAEHQQSIDAIVNVSNDGWFKGSSILDLHFRCSIFRAIENRKPVIIAANTGISAHINGNGVVLQRGPKRKPDILQVEVRPDGRRSPYHRLGDLGALLCAAATWAVAFYATLRR